MDRESLVCTKLNILVANLTFFKQKSPGKLAFQNKPFADVSDPAGYSVPSGPWHYICPVVFNCTRRPNDRVEKGNAEKDDKGVNEKNYSPLIKPINTGKRVSRSVIC